jgi:hypothetical protein
MRLVRIVSTIVLLVAAAAVAAAAPPYDGSKPMQCKIETVMACSDPAVCVRGTAQTVNLPAVLHVDVPQRVISGAATGRTIKITAVSREAGRLLISGAETAGAWNVAVVEDSGEMSSAVIARAGGFIMFGRCSSS